MNVDENPVTPSSYRVNGIPTLNVYQGGEVVKQIVGAKPKAALLRELEPTSWADPPRHGGDRVCRRHDPAAAAARIDRAPHASRAGTWRSWRASCV